MEVDTPSQVAQSILSHATELFGEFEKYLDEHHAVPLGTSGRSWTVNAPAGFSVDLTITARWRPPVDSEDGSGDVKTDLDQRILDREGHIGDSDGGTTEVRDQTDDVSKGDVAQ